MAALLALLLLAVALFAGPLFLLALLVELDTCCALLNAQQQSVNVRADL